MKINKYLENFVRFKKGYIELLIYPNGHGYPIEHDRMNNPEKLLGWIHHLSGKDGVTNEHIRALIEVAKELGVSIDFNA